MGPAVIFHSGHQNIIDIYGARRIATLGAINDDIMRRSQIFDGKLPRARTSP